jgi:hypothetical protein
MRKFASRPRHSPAQRGLRPPPPLEAPLQDGPGLPEPPGVHPVVRRIPGKQARTVSYPTAICIVVKSLYIVPYRNASRTVRQPGLFFLIVVVSSCRDNLISRVRGAATNTHSDLPFVVSVCFVEGRESQSRNFESCCNC